MSDHKQLSQMPILAVGTALLAFISLFLPLISINFLGSHSYSTMDIFEGLGGIGGILEDLEPASVSLLLVLVCTLLALIFSPYARKNKKAGTGTIIVSVIGMILMLVIMTYDLGLGIKGMDYAGIGFYLYELASLATVVLTACAVRASNHTTSVVHAPMPSEPVHTPPPAAEPKYAPAPAPKPMPNPSPKPTPVPAPKPTPVPGPKPTPVSPPVPRPEPKAKDDMVICPRCGAKQVAGTISCRYCGTGFGGTSIKKPHAPVKKEERRAICPHCGARQSEENLKCKYCGTPMR